MPELPTKITLGEMRSSGVRGLLVYCADYKCCHLAKISGDRWPDDIRLSDLEPRFVCQACGKRGAIIRGDDDSRESRHRCSSFSNALSSTASFFNGWRSMPGTIPNSFSG